MYTKRTIPALFSESTITIFYKDGVEVATRRNGVTALRPVYHTPMELTRAQGFRYWEQHFPNRFCWDLPEVLQMALEKEPTAHGEFFSKRFGDWVYYEG